MVLTLQEIADGIAAECVGDGAYQVQRAARPDAAGVNDLALAMDPKYAASLGEGQAKVAVLWPEADWQALGLTGAILVPRPRFALAGITAKFDRAPELAAGIHKSAIVDPTAIIGKNVAIGPFTVIGARVIIGDNARILSQVTIAEDVQIGDDVLLYSGVRIGSRVRIGHRFAAHFNTVIGSDGFSYVTPEKSAVEEARQTFEDSKGSRLQAYKRISSNGSVLIGDDVEVGSNVSIDKGTVANTEIGNGTKIDNLVQIGHNCRIGQNCLLCGQVGIAGSVVMGDQVVLGGRAGVSDHVILGDHVIVALASVILSNVPSGRVMMGYPATKIKQSVDSYKALRRLPRLAAKVASLEKLVSKLAKKE